MVVEQFFFLDSVAREWRGLMLERYLSRSEAADLPLDQIAALIQLAWASALASPECSDDILSDLCDDVREIIIRNADVERVKAEAAAIASTDAYWRDRGQNSMAAANSLVGSIAAVSIRDGFDPHGWYVYLLWPSRHADKPIYVGESSNLLARLGTHLTTAGRASSTRWVTFIRCESEQAMHRTERRLINHYQPAENKR